ncbi:acyloxyacyl hydrolase [Halomonas sp. HP20-15]|uniref:acyloxyacyl hydrolase n=1 Tax=Halomonas sp. HP20-15 TaxID=3085901 RepID=UPI003992AB19
MSLRLAGGVLLLPSLGDDDNAALLAAPALRYQWFPAASRPFVEFGIGAALFLDTELDERSVSTSFQFEDRLAAGMALGRGEMSLSLTHYSNAGIKRPNDGLNVAALGYRLEL